MLHGYLWPRGHLFHRPLKDGGGSGGGPGGGRQGRSWDGGGDGVRGEVRHPPYHLSRQVGQHRRDVDGRSDRCPRGHNVSRDSGGGGQVDGGLRLIKNTGGVKTTRQYFWVPFNSDRSHNHLNLEEVV